MKRCFEKLKSAPARPAANVCTQILGKVLLETFLKITSHPCLPDRQAQPFPKGREPISVLKVLPFGKDLGWDTPKIELKINVYASQPSGGFKAVSCPEAFREKKLKKYQNIQRGLYYIIRL